MHETIVSCTVIAFTGVSIWYCYLWKCELEIKKQELKIQYITLFTKVALKLITSKKSSDHMNKLFNQL